MEKRRLVVIEITEEEEKEFASKRIEILNSASRTNKIPISVNEIDIDVWEKAFSVAEPYKQKIMDLFHFYEDGKDFMRVN
jgi:Asp-tRNA(Asn)/Glu-tRNA(Gln) amidotransferase C subunit